MNTNPETRKQKNDKSDINSNLKTRSSGIRYFASCITRSDSSTSQYPMLDTTHKCQSLYSHCSLVSCRVGRTKVSEKHTASIFKETSTYYNTGSVPENRVGEKNVVNKTTRGE